MLRALAFHEDDPSRVIHRLNLALHRDLADPAMFVTLVYVVLDLETDRLTWVNAGHPDPVLSDGASIMRLYGTGGVLGISPDFAYRSASVAFPRGTLLAMFTDGVSEAAGRLDPDSDAGMSAILAEYPAGTAARYVEVITERTRQIAGDRMPDDMALVVVRRP